MGVGQLQGSLIALERDSANVESFDYVFHCHRDYVYGLTYALLGNAQDAEDVTQEVFLRVYKALPSYQPERAGMTTWLARIAVNACQTHRRRNFLRNLLHHDTNDQSDEQGPVDFSILAAPEDHALQSEVRAAVQKALSRMRPEHRTVLVLHYYLDLSCPEIARILDCPEGTVYSRLHYARRVAQAHLSRHTDAREQR